MTTNRQQHLVFKQQKQRNMERRFLSIWFPHLMANWQVRHQPEFQDTAFVMAASERGRKVVKAVSPAAQTLGIEPGTVVADAKAIFPALQVLDDQPDKAEKLLTEFAEWCIRYTPVISLDAPDGLILDISGCAHLWGGEYLYLKEIHNRLKSLGYESRMAIADTIGLAWAVARYRQHAGIIEPGVRTAALLSLPPSALRLEPGVLARMHKLGLYHISNFIDMPRSVLRRRFGQPLLDRIAQALGEVKEPIQPIKPLEPYQERLPCLEPIRTATGIEIALKKLLEALCQRLYQEGKGLRSASFKGYRIDGKMQQIDIGTNSPSRNLNHLFKLFALKIATIAPGLGIELFLLEAPVVENLSQAQETLWNMSSDKEDTAITDLLDRLAARVGFSAIHRYLPDEHYWPERSVKLAATLTEKSVTAWKDDLPRPVCLLTQPEPIEVSVAIPDYPPMLFRHKGKIHKIIKADGPERIEPEWWIKEATGQSLHRDYYCVEDESGARYWLFRSGHYDVDDPKWYLHGFFA